jgi:hypothetical protein
MLALYPANWQSPTVFYDPRALAQRNPCVWPTLARSPIGRPRDNEVLKAGEMLKDALAVTSPDVDPVDKVGSGNCSESRRRFWRSRDTGTPRLAATTRLGICP